MDKPATARERVRGLRLRELRVALKLTQEGLAIGAGFDRTVINKIESGANKATSSLVWLGLARAFGVRIEDMGSFLAGDIPLHEMLQLVRYDVKATGTDGSR